MLNKVLATGLALALAACASEPRRELRHRGGPPGERFAHGLFISPSGEPFRGGDGLARWFAGADADHDGAISLAEFQADAVRFFKTLDVNGDGVIDGFELQAYEQKVAPEIAAYDFDRPQRAEGGEQRGPMGGGMGRRERGGGRGRRGPGGGGDDGPGRVIGGPGMGGGREGAARYSLINEPEPLANADENVDGRVSLEEWKHATLRRFAVLDKAGTGRLTLDQLKGKVPPKPKP